MTILLTALAALCAGTAAVLNKKLALKGHRASTYTVVIMLTSTLISIPFLFYRFQIAHSPATWAIIIISVLSYALSFAFIMKAYKEADVSAVSIIQRLNIVIVAAIGIIFLKEAYAAQSYIGLIFILLSGIIIMYEKKKLHVKPEIAFALIGTVFASLSSALDKVVLQDFSPYTYLFFNNLLVGMVFSFRGHILTDAPALIKKNYVSIILTSALMTASFLLILLVLQDSAVSWVIPIYKGLSLIIPVSFGILLLKERQKMYQKVMGIALGIIGIYLLY